MVFARAGETSGGRSRRNTAGAGPNSAAWEQCEADRLWAMANWEIACRWESSTGMFTKTNPASMKAGMIAVTQAPEIRQIPLNEIRSPK